MLTRVLQNSGEDLSRAMVLRPNTSNTPNIGNTLEDVGKEGINWYMNMRKEFNKDNIRYEELWNSVRNRQLNLETVEGVKDLNDLVYKNKDFVLAKTKEMQMKTQSKPLGEFGDITLNDLATKAIELGEPLYKYGQEHIKDIHMATSVVSVLFVYKTLVRLYIKTAYGKDFSIKDINLLDFKSTRSKEVFAFMVLGAPIIAGAISFIGSTAISKKLLVEVDLNNNTLSVADATTTTSSLFFIKMPKIVKKILTYLFFIFLFKFILWVLDYKNTVISNIIPIKAFIIVAKIFIFISILMIFYYIWSIFLIKKFIDGNKILIYEFYPKPIKNRILELKKLCEVEPIEHTKILKFYYKTLLLYIIGFLLNIFFLVIIV